jgi:hypothetical protein
MSTAAALLPLRHRDDEYRCGTDAATTPLLCFVVIGLSPMSDHGNYKHASTVGIVQF